MQHGFIFWGGHFHHPAHLPLSWNILFQIKVFSLQELKKNTVEISCSAFLIRNGILQPWCPELSDHLEGFVKTIIPFLVKNCSIALIVCKLLLLWNQVNFQSGSYKLYNVVLPLFCIPKYRNLCLCLVGFSICSSGLVTSIVCTCRLIISRLKEQLWLQSRCNMHVVLPFWFYFSGIWFDRLNTPWPSPQCK